MSCTTGGKNFKFRNYNIFGSKIFFLMEGFLNFETSILVVTSLFQNWNYLTCVFQLLEIVEGFNQWFSWLSYRKVTFKGTYFYRTPLVDHYKRSSILQWSELSNFDETVERRGTQFQQLHIWYNIIKSYVTVRHVSMSFFFLKYCTDLHFNKKFHHTAIWKFFENI